MNSCAQGRAEVGSGWLQPCRTPQGGRAGGKIRRMSEPSAEKLKTRRVSVLLSQKAENHLVKRVRVYGDITRLVLEAIAATNLTTLTLERRRKTRGPDKPEYVPRQVVMPQDVHDALRKAVKSRKTSLNALVSSAIVHHFDTKTDKT